MVRVGVLGCGFISSYFLPLISKNAKEIILIDRELVSSENYENYTIPKYYNGKPKVLAFGSLLSILSNIKVHLIKKNIKNEEELSKIWKEYRIDLGICTFDNVKGRKIVKSFAIRNKKDVLFAGVSDNCFYVDWENWVYIPREEEIAEEVRKIRDVCTRREFQKIGFLAASFTFLSFDNFIRRKEKTAYIGYLRNNRVYISSIIRASGRGRL